MCFVLGSAGATCSKTAGSRNLKSPQERRTSPGPDHPSWWAAASHHRLRVCPPPNPRVRLEDPRIHWNTL